MLRKEIAMHDRMKLETRWATLEPYGKMLAFQVFFCGKWRWMPVRARKERPLTNAEHSPALGIMTINSGIPDFSHHFSI